MNLKRALATDGWMTEEELYWIAQRAHEHANIIEVGCFVGRTTIAMADNTYGTVFAIDTWSKDWMNEIRAVDPKAHELASKYPDHAQAFYHNLADELNEFRVIAIQGSLYDFRRKVDMIFLDGSHIEDSIEKDIQWALERLQPGGLLCGHDYKEPLWSDVTKVIDRHFKTVENPVGSIWYV